MNEEEIIKLFKKMRDEKRNNFNRVLPINELLSDRWEKAKYLKAGRRSNVYDSSYIFGEPKIGDDVFIGANTCLEGTDGITIGDHCQISFGVHIYTHDSVNNCLTGGKAKFNRGPVSIGERTYIGPLSIITSGVTIGKQCIIGALTLVNKDIPDNSIAFGIPVRILGKTIVKGENVTIEYFNKK